MIMQVYNQSPQICPLWGDEQAAGSQLQPGQDVRYSPQTKRKVLGAAFDSKSPLHKMISRSFLYNLWF